MRKERKERIVFMFFIIYLLIAFTGCQFYSDEPGTPELLYAVRSDDDQVTIMWMNSDNAESYTVFWSENSDPVKVSGSSKTFIALEGSTRTAVFSHTDFTTDAALYFWVYAENYLGTSPTSSSKKVASSIPNKEWTIMVWLDGDNSLESAAKEDFHEMEAGLYEALQSDPDIMDSVNILVQYDSEVPDDYGRFLIQPRASEIATDSPYYGKLYGGLVEEPNMGSAVELQDFIQFSKLIYPADRYALILWNHGGGVRSLQADSSSRAICEDSTDNDILYIGEIKDGLDAADSVDFLGMDACLMGMTEIAYEFRPVLDDFDAQAMAFSPAEEQGDGWEYQNIISRFRSYDLGSMDGADLARIVVEEYKEAYSSYAAETQTAVDLTKIAAVKEKLDLMAALIAGNPANKDILEGLRGFGADPVLMHYFDAASGYEWENYAGFDLDALADAVYTNSSGEIQTAAANLKTALEATIIDSWAGSSYTDTGFEPGKNGLSIFFPDGDADNANRTDDTYTYWTYQYFYSSLPHDVISTWAGNSGLNYGAIDFCNGDGDGTVEGWFELLQYWYNPTGSDSIHPGPMW